MIFARLYFMPCGTAASITLAVLCDSMCGAAKAQDANAKNSPQPAASAQKTGTNAPTKLETVTVSADLDRAREESAPGLGAVTYTIGPGQIQSMGQGENSSFQQVLLHAPGVVQEEFGEIHVRGDHGDLQYRVNGVLLPESLNGFGQEID